jgi:hypothetical protein
MAVKPVPEGYHTATPYLFIQGAGAAIEYYDPFGHMWTIATHTEDVPPEEMERRADAQTRKETGERQEGGRSAARTPMGGKD